MLIIVDIDGTIADWSRRAKKAGIAPERSDKKAFQNWLDSLQSEEELVKDTPIWEIVELVKRMQETAQIVFLTGRSDRYRGVTMEWLHKLPFNFNMYRSLMLRMRTNKDYRSAAEYKKEALMHILTEYPHQNVLAIDDDYDGDCTAVYAELGIRHLKVMPR